MGEGGVRESGGGRDSVVVWKLVDINRVVRRKLVGGGERSERE